MGRGARQAHEAILGFGVSPTRRRSYHRRPAAERPAVRRVGLPDGRGLSVRHWPGEGRPVVLLHGLLDEAAGWDDVARSTTRPVLAFDLPGFGASDRPAGATMEAFAADVADAIRAEGLRSFTLVGHSLGGGVAAHVADLLPDRVASLALMAPAGFAANPIAQAVSAPGVRQVVGAGLPLVLANPLLVAGAYATTVAGGRLPSRELLGRVRAQALRVGPAARAAVQAIADAGRGDMTLFARRSRYTGPVHALWGAGDVLIPVAHQDGVKACFPQAQVTVWDGMAHHPQHERPEQLATFVESCCDQRPDKAPARSIEQIRQTRERVRSPGVAQRPPRSPSDARLSRRSSPR